MANQNLVDATRRTKPVVPDDGNERAGGLLIRAADTEPQRSLAVMIPGARARQALALNGSVVFLGKLSERLAFERLGVRLYDALLSKHDAWGSWGNGPRRAELENLRRDEHEHFMMLQGALADLGADVAAVTAAASSTGVFANGVPAAITDTRTGLRESLEAILVAELVDNDCWENLSDLASALHHDDWAVQFEGALAQERGHVSLLRRWLGTARRWGPRDEPRRGET